MAERTGVVGMTTFIENDLNRRAEMTPQTRGRVKLAFFFDGEHIGGKLCNSETSAKAKAKDYLATGVV